MNIVVIGLGSMGKRRIRLIKEMYPDYVIFGIDQREDRREEAAKELGIKTAVSMDSVPEKIDCAFVCTSPLTHTAIISECLRRKWHVFTELNLVSDGYEKNMKLAKDNGCKLFLSSTFFYREEIKYIRSKITKDKEWNYIYHIQNIIRIVLNSKSDSNNNDNTGKQGSNSGTIPFISFKSTTLVRKLKKLEKEKRDLLVSEAKNLERLKKAKKRFIKNKI